MDLNDKHGIHTNISSLGQRRRSWMRLLTRQNRAEHKSRSMSLRSELHTVPRSFTIPNYEDQTCSEVYAHPVFWSATQNRHRQGSSSDIYFGPCHLLKTLNVDHWGPHRLPYFNLKRRVLLEFVERNCSGSRKPDFLHTIAFISFTLTCE